jgi:hypothetical protein
MPARLLPHLLVPALLLLVAAGAAAAPARRATTYKVTSTLDGKRVLPRRIGWTVTVSPEFPKSGLVGFYGGVQWKVPQRIDREGGWWCYAGGPVGTYDWSVSGGTLTLTPAGGADPCGVRGFIWAGQWTRVG